MTRNAFPYAILLALFLAVQPPANAALRATQLVTFRGAEASLGFPGGTPQCDSASAAVTTFTLPGSTMAPTSADTQLAWTPNGNQSGSYSIAVKNPSGVTITTWTIGADSKTQVTYSAAGQPAGPWSFVESGLASSSCTNGALMNHTGIASGSASWVQP
jgi:hypothetical protein